VRTGAFFSPVLYLKAVLSDLLEGEKQVKFDFYISDFCRFRVMHLSYAQNEVSVGLRL